MVFGSDSVMPWINKMLIDPFMLILRRGAEPKQLAFSTALGLTLGVFPICGVTVLLCGMAIALFGSRCHAPSVLLANFVATPIELSIWGTVYGEPLASHVGIICGLIMSFLIPENIVVWISGVSRTQPTTTEVDQG